MESNDSCFFLNHFILSGIDWILCKGLILSSTTELSTLTRCSGSLLSASEWFSDGWFMKTRRLATDWTRLVCRETFHDSQPLLITDCVFLLLLSFQKLVTFLWAWSMVTLVAVVFGVYPYFAGLRKPGKLETVLYGSFYRFLWALALSWVIYACVFGYGGNHLSRSIYLSFHFPIFFLIPRNGQWISVVEGVPSAGQTQLLRLPY